MGNAELINLDINSISNYPLFRESASAGFGSPAEGFMEKRVVIDDLLSLNLFTIFVRASGDSMIGAKIFSDDFLVVNTQSRPKSGDIVLAMLNNDFFVKELYVGNGHIKLISHNANYPPIVITKEMGLEVRGVVTGAIHVFKKQFQNNISRRL